MRKVAVVVALLIAGFAAWIVVNRHEIDDEGDGLDFEDIADYVTGKTNFNHIAEGQHQHKPTTTERQPAKPAPSKPKSSQPADANAEQEAKIMSAMKGFVKEGYAELFEQLDLDDETAGKVVDLISERKRDQGYVLRKALDPNVSDEEVLEYQRELFAKADAKLGKVLDDDQVESLNNFEGNVPGKIYEDLVNGQIPTEGLSPEGAKFLKKSLVQKSLNISKSEAGILSPLHSDAPMTPGRIGKERQVIQAISTGDTGPVREVENREHRKLIAAISESDELTEADKKKITADLIQQNKQTNAMLEMSTGGAPRGQEE